MSFLQWIGIGKEIAKPIEAVGNLYTTDKARIEAEKDFEEVTQKVTLGQQEINKIYAQSSSFFVNAWGPLTGWTAGACVALYYVPQLLIANYVWAMNCIHNNSVVPFPIDPTNINQLVYLMFGFGGYHLVKDRLSK